MKKRNIISVVSAAFLTSLMAASGAVSADSKRKVFFRNCSGLS